jgi:hypothetical protein
VICILLVLILAIASIATAADKPDFSGTYTLTGAKGGFKLKKGESWTLEVSQADSTIEVTTNQNGLRTKNKFLFSGAESIYVSPGGVKGTSKTQLKGKTLTIETFINSSPTPNGTAAQLHTRERWELSSDSKTLTIQHQVDSPSVPGGFQVIEPWSEIYTRN